MKQRRAAWRVEGIDVRVGCKPSNGPHLSPPRPAGGEWPEDICVQLNADALHDLVGPVNQMRSMADLILKRHRGKLDDEDETLFGFLQTSSDRLQNLLAGLRTYTRIVGRREPYRHFDASAILAGALATIQPAMDRSEAVVTHDPLPEVYGDPSQICYIFSSLIENSIKFRSQSRPEIHVTAIPDENDWLFSVCDNGIGIDPRHVERVFGVFKRIHSEEYPGAGMGLAIAKRIIESHGGRIWVESHLGQGATFFFTLPNTSGHAAHSAGASQAMPSPANS
jgi:light-regulated signal transduction histidine kinase (bacteriophytochrome)